MGLGYLTLGQPSTSLSGGEAQRVKLAAELARPGKGRTLYVLDEFTTGLHPEDVARVLALLDRLIAAGHTVVAVENDRDVLAAADHVVALGPGSGSAGGRVVTTGAPEDLEAPPGTLPDPGGLRPRAPADLTRSGSAACAPTTCARWTSASPTAR